MSIPNGVGRSTRSRRRRVGRSPLRRARRAAPRSAAAPRLCASPWALQVWGPVLFDHAPASGDPGGQRESGDQRTPDGRRYSVNAQLALLAEQGEGKDVSRSAVGSDSPVAGQPEGAAKSALG